MNNLITFIKQASTQGQVISLLKHNDIFNYVKNYLMDNHDIDYTDGQFLDEQNVLSIRDLQAFVTEAIRESLK